MPLHLECRHLHQVHGDPKNFHAWKYRSWIALQLSLHPSADLEFTEQLLKADPSNFSAWHMRMVALSAAHSIASKTASDLPDASLPAIKHKFPQSDGDRFLSSLEHSSNDVIPAVEMKVEGGLTHSTDATTTEQRAQPRRGTQVLPLQFSVIEQELKLLHEVRR